MIRKIISWIIVFAFCNLLLAQTNTQTNFAPVPSFTTLIQTWARMNDANYMTLKKNTPFWEANDVVIVTPGFMSKILQEGDQYKANETIYTNKISMLLTRVADRESALDVANSLYKVGQKRIENLTNEIAFANSYIDFQDKTIEKMFKREKWGVVGNVLIFVGGVILGALIVFGGFTIASSILIK